LTSPESDPAFERRQQSGRRSHDVTAEEAQKRQAAAAAAERQALAAKKFLDDERRAHFRTRVLIVGCVIAALLGIWFVVQLVSDASSAATNARRAAESAEKSAKNSRAAITGLEHVTKQNRAFTVALDRVAREAQRQGAATDRKQCLQIRRLTVAIRRTLQFFLKGQPTQLNIALAPFPTSECRRLPNARAVKPHPEPRQGPP
jgi:uncharacterized protein HemX